MFESLSCQLSNGKIIIAKDDESRELLNKLIGVDQQLCAVARELNKQIGLVNGRRPDAEPIEYFIPAVYDSDGNSTMYIITACDIDATVTADLRSLLAETEETLALMADLVLTLTGNTWWTQLQLPEFSESSSDSLSSSEPEHDSEYWMLYWYNWYNSSSSSSESSSDSSSSSSSSDSSSSSSF